MKVLVRAAVRGFACAIVAWSSAGMAAEYLYTGGKQTFTVQQDGLYRVAATGGSGGESNGLIGFDMPGGLGATIGGDVRLTAGTVLNIFVGGMGENAQRRNSFGQWGGGGGGGGTFVVFNASGAALIVAGGGGGGGGDGSDASGAGASGTGGGGRGSPTTGGGDAGFNANGSAGSILYGSGTQGRGGTRVAAGAAGGVGGSSLTGIYGGQGGYGGGGGGGTRDASGGGGGYTGGDAGGRSGSFSANGLAGTSFLIATAAERWGGTALTSGNGSVTIDLIAPAVAAVPETTTWAMMLLGFGAIGAGMRARRRSITFSAA